MSEKTEQPTAKRLKRAREQGDSAVSSGLGQALTFSVVLALLPGCLAAVAIAAAGALQAAITTGHAEPQAAAWLWLGLASPLVGAAGLAGLTAGLVQTGASFTASRFKPDFARLDPINGLRGLISLERLFSLARSLLAAAAVSYLAWKLTGKHLVDLVNSAGRGEATIALAWQIARPVLWGAASVGLVLGGADYFFVRRAWLARHRMTKDEVKREHREAEGDPEIKAARRRAHQEALAGSMIAAVKNATVLIVNPTHLAMGLRYQEAEDEAPTIVAQGEGDLAQRMIEAAHAFNVPVVRDVPIAHALRDLELGEQIPEALYEAVAVILRELVAPES